MRAGGAVAASGKVLKNDVVIKVNGTPVSEDTVASDIIKATRGDITFVVRREPAPAPGTELKKTSSMSKLNPFKRKNSKTGLGSKTNLIVPGAGMTTAPTSPPAVAAAPEAAADEGADATATITLLLKRKNGSFGLGVRDDNYVQEVDEGSSSHEAGICVGDWVRLAAAAAATSPASLENAPPLPPWSSAPLHLPGCTYAQIVSIGGVSFDDNSLHERYAATLPLLKAIKDVPTPFVVRYNPDVHPNRVAPPVAPRRTVPFPPPTAAPAPARTASTAETTTAELGATAASAPTLTAAQVAEGVRVVSIAKPEAGSRLGITLTSEDDALLRISTLAPDALGGAARSKVASLARC